MIESNCIDDECIEVLVQANWPNLKKLFLGINCLMQAKMWLIIMGWKNLAFVVGTNCKN